MQLAFAIVRGSLAIAASLSQAAHKPSQNPPQSEPSFVCILLKQRCDEIAVAASPSPAPRRTPLETACAAPASAQSQGESPWFPRVRRTFGTTFRQKSDHICAGPFAKAVPTPKPGSPRPCDPCVAEGLRAVFQFAAEKEKEKEPSPALALALALAPAPPAATLCAAAAKLSKEDAEVWESCDEVIAALPSMGQALGQALGDCICPGPCDADADELDLLSKCCGDISKVKECKPDIDSFTAKRAALFAAERSQRRLKIDKRALYRAYTSF